jgi:hypothetical protein
MIFPYLTVPELLWLLVRPFLRGLAVVMAAAGIALAVWVLR